MDPNQLVSVIIPAHNEALCIGVVIDQLQHFIAHTDLPFRWEILVVDNGSTDNTAAVALQHGATVIREPRLGYGAACWHGTRVGQGDIFLFIDGDGAVAIEDCRKLLLSIIQGSDFAIGVRTNPEPGSMTIAQRFGNQLACTLIGFLWQYPVRDLGPFRAIRRDVFDQLRMADRDYGWTIEMQLKAYGLKLFVVEVPVRWRARVSGSSKIGGTITGVFRAGKSIIGMIAKFWWQRRSIHNPPFNHSKTFPRTNKEIHDAKFK